MKRPTIISLGEVLWDLFPDGERFGGAPANFACHAAIQGADVIMLSAVGDDKNGHDAMGILSAYGIDVSLMQIIPDAPTGTVGVTLNNNGKPTYVIHQGSAWDQLIWNDAMASRITIADAVSFGTLGQRHAVSGATIRRAVEAAASKGIPCVLDINLRPPFFDAEMIRDSVQLASILKLSDDELVEVCSACGINKTDQHEGDLRGLLEFGSLDMVVLTRGKDGAVLVTHEGTFIQDGIDGNVIDTVGAGDAFTAAFLVGELRGDPHDQTLRNSCQVAAATCAHSGALQETRVAPLNNNDISDTGTIT